MPLSLANLATSIARPNLLSLGTCLVRIESCEVDTILNKYYHTRSSSICYANRGKTDRLSNRANSAKR